MGCPARSHTAEDYEMRAEGAPRYALPGHHATTYPSNGLLHGATASVLPRANARSASAASSNGAAHNLNYGTVLYTFFVISCVPVYTV